MNSAHRVCLKNGIPEVGVERSQDRGGAAHMAPEMDSEILLTPILGDPKSGVQILTALLRVRNDYTQKWGPEGLLG